MSAARRVIVSKKGGALGDRFDELKRKKGSGAPEKRRAAKGGQVRQKRTQKLDKKRDRKPAPKKKREPKKALTAAELDAQLDSYNLKNEERGKDYLDAQLDEYNRQRDEAAKAAPVEVADE